METIPFRDRYGAHEVNGLPEGGQEALLDQMHEDGNVEVYWSDPQLAKITRLRFLTDRDFPYFDLSYCYGVLKDGRTCRVQLPFGQLLKAKWKSQIIEYAARDGVFAKGLGIFEADVMSYVN
jgi:hypothetical protein